MTIPLGVGIAGWFADAIQLRCRRVRPFEFTGTIRDVVIDVSGDLIVNPEAQMRAVMAHQ